MFVDSHAHLNDTKFDGDRQEVLARYLQEGGAWLINVAYDLKASRQAVKLAHQSDFVFAAVGVHPHDAARVSPEILGELEELALDGRVVAWGEIGLDYYRNLSPRHVQQEVFRQQLARAKQLGLPVIIHDRDAHEDVLAILAEGAPTAVLLHCFSGSWDMARCCLDAGYYLSFAGNVTFKKASQIQEVARRAPLDRMLIETDCPYLSPEPRRGKRNEPVNVALVAEKIASLRNISMEEVARVTSSNAGRFFNVPVK